MKYTLLTGASSGIGEEFARQYAKRGHNLILVARSIAKLESMAKELIPYRIKIRVIEQDLSELNSAEELFKKLQSLNLEINFLINDAGIGLIGEFQSHDLNQIEKMLLLNVMTVTKLTYLLLPQLKRNEGTLLNVASQAAFEPTPYMAAYGATKSYVLSFTEALRVELENSKVQVMALCPGPTYTKFFERANSSPDKINFKFRTPKEVVAEAIKGIESKKAIAMPGWENNFYTFLTRFMPRSLLAKLSQYMLK